VEREGKPGVNVDAADIIDKTFDTYRRSTKGKEAYKKYQKSSKGTKVRNAYNNSAKGMQTRQDYLDSEKGKTALKSIADKRWLMRKTSRLIKDEGLSYEAALGKAEEAFLVERQSRVE